MSSPQKQTQFCQKHHQPQLEICGRQSCLNLYCFQCFTQHRAKYAFSGQDHNISVTFSNKSKDFFIRWNRYLIPKLDEMIKALKFQGTYKNIFYIFIKDKNPQTGQIVQRFDQSILNQTSTTQLTRICIQVMSSHMNLIVENVKYLSSIIDINELSNRQFLRDLFFLFVEDAQKNLKMIPRIIQERISDRFGVIDIYQKLGVRFNPWQAEQMEKARRQILKQYEQKGTQVGVMNNHVKINTSMKQSHGQFMSASPGNNKNNGKQDIQRSVITPFTLPRQQNGFGHDRHSSGFSHRFPVFSSSEQVKSHQLYQSGSSKKLEQKLQEILNFTSNMIKAQSQSYKQDSQCGSVQCKSIQGDREIHFSKEPATAMNSASKTLKEQSLEFSRRFQQVQAMKQKIVSLQNKLRQGEQKRMRFQVELSAVNQENFLLKGKLKEHERLGNRNQNDGQEKNGEVNAIEQRQINKLKGQIENLSKSLKGIELIKLSLECELQKMNQKYRLRQQETQKMIRKMEDKHQEQLQIQKNQYEKALNSQNSQIEQMKRIYQKYIQQQNQGMFIIKSNYEKQKEERQSMYERIREQLLNKLQQKQNRIARYQQELSFAKQKEDNFKCSEQQILKTYFQSLSQLDTIAEKLRNKEIDYQKLKQSNELLRETLQSSKSNWNSINGEDETLRSQENQQKKFIQNVESKISQEGQLFRSRETFRSDQSQNFKPSVSLAQEQAEAFLEQAKKINMQLAVENSLLKREKDDLQIYCKKLQKELRNKTAGLNSVNIDEELLADIILLESEVAAQKNNVQKTIQFMLSYADETGINRNDMLEKLKVFRQNHKRTGYQQQWISAISSKKIISK